MTLYETAKTLFETWRSKMSEPTYCGDWVTLTNDERRAWEAVAAISMQREKDDAEPQIFNVCLALHADVHGSADPLPYEERQRLLGWLYERVRNWKPAGRGSVLFDHAALGVCLAVLAEVSR